MALTQNQSQAIELAKAIRTYKELARVTKMMFYSPYQKQKDFHTSGADYSERCLGAGNQLGKTLAGATEVAYHMTGLYPDWWDGLRFDKPTRIWICGVSGKDVRDSTQRLLLGDVDVESDFGTGTIPKHLINKVNKAGGTTGLCDNFSVT